MFGPSFSPSRQAAGEGSLPAQVLRAGCGYAPIPRREGVDLVKDRQKGPSPRTALLSKRGARLNGTVGTGLREWIDP